MNLQLGLFPDDDAPAPAPPVGSATVPVDVAATAERLAAAVRLGTSSWSFPGWEGIVYDRRATGNTLARHGLAAYARHPLLRTVGIDRTYYRPIDADDFRRYADAVPDDFRFLVKADRLVTSPLEPEGYGVRSANPRFLDAAYATEHVVRPMLEGLGDKAGPLLFQLSPMPASLVGGHRAFLARLLRFVRALPEGPVYAVELRTPSLLCDEYVRLLETTGIAHCYNVHPSMTPLADQLRLVSPFYQPCLVVRWMLRKDLTYEVAKARYEPFERLADEDVEARERIAVAVLDALVAERPALVIASNKAEGCAPLTLTALARRIVDGASSDGSAAEMGGASHGTAADAPGGEVAVDAP